MSLTKSTVIDQITIAENGIILYREATSFLEDGVAITKTFYRSSLTPGQDLTGVPANVVAHCNTAWTADVVAAYEAVQAAAAAERQAQQPAEQPA